MPSAALLTQLNEQIEHEFESSNIYLAMSAWCVGKGLRGSASFFELHADEELRHMRKIFSYLGEVGGRAIVPALPKPPSEFASLNDVVAKAFEHEKFITGKIHALAEKALAEKDYATFTFLQWYVSEQVEEEALFQGIVDMIALAGTDGRGLYLVDKEIGKIAKKEAGGDGKA
jgi:ferritin